MGRGGGVFEEMLDGGFEGENESEEQEGDTEETGLKKKGDGLILNDFFRGGDFGRVGGVHGGAGAAETDAEKHSEGRLGPSGESGGAEVEANIGGFGDVAIEGGGRYIF